MTRLKVIALRQARALELLHEGVSPAIGDVPAVGLKRDVVAQRIGMSADWLRVLEKRLRGMGE